MSKKDLEEEHIFRVVDKARMFGDQAVTNEILSKMVDVLKENNANKDRVDISLSKYEMLQTKIEVQKTEIARLKEDIEQFAQLFRRLEISPMIDQINLIKDIKVFWQTDHQHQTEVETIKITYNKDK